MPALNPPSDDSKLLLDVRSCLTVPKDLAITWGDGRHSVICLWTEVPIAPFKFDNISVNSDSVTWSAADVTVTASRLAELAEAQQADPIPPAVFASWRCAKGLSPADAAKHLEVGLADVEGYESGARPIPRFLALMCREWLGNEEVRNANDWVNTQYVTLLGRVEEAREAFVSEGDQNKGLSLAAHVLGWIAGGKRQKKLSVFLLPVLYKKLISPGPVGPPLPKWQAVDRLCKEFGLASPEATRQAIASRAKELEDQFGADWLAGLLPSTRPGTKHFI